MTLKDIEVRASEIREAMTAEDADIQALTEETRSLIEEKSRLMAEIAEQEAEAEQRKADMEAVIENRGTEIEEIIEEKKDMTEIRDSKEYIDAYAEYIKTGDATECRALLSENASGTVAIPTLVYDIVKTAWEKDGIMSLVRKSYLKGNLKIGFEISGSDATVHTEGGTAVTEETLTLGIVNLVPKSIKKWISISDEALDLRGEAFLNYIYDELAYRIAHKAADALVADIIACTAAATTGKPAVGVVSESTVGVGTVAKAMATLSDEAANPVVIMNKATWGAFKAAQYAGSFDVDPFEGLPVVFNNSMTAYSAATTGVTYAIVGDLGQGALANFPAGGEIEFKYDDLTLAPQDLVRVIGRQFVGIGVVANNAFAKITK